MVSTKLLLAKNYKFKRRQVPLSGVSRCKSLKEVDETDWTDQQFGPEIILIENTCGEYREDRFNKCNFLIKQGREVLLMSCNMFCFQWTACKTRAAFNTA